MGPDGSFITGSDVLMDGGLTAAYFHGSDASAESLKARAVDAAGVTERTAR